jgi:hypothetical protein
MLLCLTLFTQSVVRWIFTLPIKLVFFFRYTLTPARQRFYHQLTSTPSCPISWCQHYKVLFLCHLEVGQIKQAIVHYKFQVIQSIGD